jgi:hypothetical protein
VVQKALEAARDHLFTGRRPGEEPEARNIAVGWSDALLHVAEVALANLEGTGAVPTQRYQVILHANLGPGGPEGLARLHLGPALPAWVRRYLGCDATFRAIVESAGTPVSILARQRSVDERLRALVEDRDRGCRVPGCGARRWLHVHHIVHAEDGGPTTYANLCCLCRYHHRLHHRGRLGIRGDPTTPDGLVFTGPDGRPIPGPSPKPPGMSAAEALAAAGLPTPTWQTPFGETLQEKWVTWSRPKAETTPA